MARRDRETLRGYFKHGALPTEDHFKDLIESMLNMRDEGFDRTDDHGWELYAKDNGQSIISFFSDVTAKTPHWTVKYDLTNKSSLQLSSVATTIPLMTFVPPDLQVEEKTSRLGINQPNPQDMLDVAGYVKAKGFKGEESFLVPADGRYHDITPVLTGVNGFEVVAGIGVTGTNIYGIARSLALNSGYPSRWYDVVFSWALPLYQMWEKLTNNQEDAQTDFFRGRRGIKTEVNKFENGEIRLRWLERDEGYVLQMKSLCDCHTERTRQTGASGGNVYVRYHLKTLWEDYTMQGCESRVAPEDLDAEDA